MSLSCPDGRISHILSLCLNWSISHVLYPCLEFPIINGASILYCSIFNPLPSIADVSNTQDLAFAFAISCWTFSFSASFSAICHLIKDDSSASSSANFAFSSTALVLELSDLLLQLDLFETFDLLLLLVLTGDPFDKWLLLDCQQIRSSSAFFSQVWVLKDLFVHHVNQFITFYLFFFLF